MTLTNEYIYIRNHPSYDYNNACKTNNIPERDTQYATGEIKIGYFEEVIEVSNAKYIEEPEIIFKRQFKNWIDYLSIERIYYDFEICKNKVGEYLSLYSEIKKYYLDLSIVSNKLCKIDALFPPNELWVEYYNVKDLRDIITIINNKKKIGVIM